MYQRHHFPGVAHTPSRHDGFYEFELGLGTRMIIDRRINGAEADHINPNILWRQLNRRYQCEPWSGSGSRHRRYQFLCTWRGQWSCLAGADGPYAKWLKVFMIRLSHFLVIPKKDRSITNWNIWNHWCTRQDSNLWPLPSEEEGKQNIYIALWILTYIKQSVRNIYMFLISCNFLFGGYYMGTGINLVPHNDHQNHQSLRG